MPTTWPDGSPMADDVLAQAARVMSPATRIAFPDVVVSGGSGAHFWDDDGRRFLDLHSMAAIMNIGYGHPRHVAAIVAQAQQLVHCNPAYTVHEAPVRLASRLVELTPGDFAKRVAFGCSGSDAIDGAIKLARAATGRSGIITYAGAYHGNTYGALSISSASPAMSDGFGPVVPDVVRVDFPRVRADEDADSRRSRVHRALADLDDAVRSLASCGGAAAIVVEPIQGDAGVIVPPAEYVAGLADLAKRHGILVIADEVQTGFGRTGRLFAAEHFALEPDIVVLGKALGGGMPISAVVARSELMDSWRAPGHVFSTSANPVAAAAALAVLDIVRDEGLVKRSHEAGAMLRAGLLDLQREHAIVREVRGAGLMLGAEVTADHLDGTTDRLLTAKIVKRCFDRGCFVTFLAGSVLRFVPPLVISDEDIGLAVEIVAEACDAAADDRVTDDEVADLTGW